MAVNQTNGQVLSQDDVRAFGKVHEVYTGSGFNSSQSGAGNDEQSHELNAIDADQLVNAKYIKISMFINCGSYEDSTSSRYAVVKIQEKYTGGSYSDILAYFTPTQVQESGTGGGISGSFTQYFEYWYELTANDKSNGCQFQIFSKSIVSGTGTQTCTNRQVVVQVEYE